MKSTANSIICLPIFVPNRLIILFSTVYCHGMVNYYSRTKNWQSHDVSFSDVTFRFFWLFKTRQHSKIFLHTDVKCNAHAIWMHKNVSLLCGFFPTKYMRSAKRKWCIKFIHILTLKCLPRNSIFYGQ